ncbi:MAG TPA: ABC transporter ATP-binding protein [Candidatus Dormibacteraeota bacterium]|nr:ABC transporter ATP-binding protein [Candidatus Dormibacteraeota bacterium]
MSETPLLATDALSRHFRLGGLFSSRTLHAVDDVDLQIGEREIVALVGESGSGKSTMARLLALLYRPTTGKILFRGKDVAAIRSRADLRRYRAQVPMVFQDPYSSINPVYRVSHGVLRALALHRPSLTRAERMAEAERVFETVGLTPARDMLRKFPYEMSGGQRQRVGFAQALAVNPSLILADEPVSMLDVSIRAGILNLMLDLRDRIGVSILFITHDIASARYVADRIAVMYAGHLVETGPTEEVLANPRHPYSQLLVSAVPDPHSPIDVDVSAAAGEPPRVIDPAEGCRFMPRCPLAIEICGRVTPRLTPMGPDHAAACHVAAQQVAAGAAV